MNSSKPWIQPRQVLALDFQRQAEEVAFVKTTAVVSAAMALPHVTIDGVERVIYRDFLAGGEIALCKHETFMISGIDEAVGIAGMVDAAFGRLHQDDSSVRKKIAVLLQLFCARPERMFRIDHARVIEPVEDGAAPKYSRHEHSTALDGRGKDR